jgi:hypothetical protein
MLKDFLYFELTHETTPDDKIIPDITFDDLKNAERSERRAICYFIGEDLPDGSIFRGGQKVTIGGQLQDALTRLRLTDHKD